MSDLSSLIERVEAATGGFKNIPGFDGRYQVSPEGVVRRSDGLVMSWSKPRSRREYPCVHLRRGSERKCISVHRLVAMTHLPEPTASQVEVRHLDGDHMNPSLSNLAWGSKIENAHDRDIHGTTARGHRHGMYGKSLAGSKNGNAKLSEAEVSEIRSLAGTMPQRSIAARFSVHQAVVWRIIHGRSWNPVKKDAAILRARQTEPHHDES